MLSAIRDKVLSAFDPKTKGYSHVLPFNYTNFIDGMAWVSIMAGAAKLKGDDEVLGRCVDYLNVFYWFSVDHKPDVRNFAPYQVKESWKQAINLKLWYKEKPQSFAGPSAIHWANDLDTGVICDWIENPKDTAQALTSVGSVFGVMIRFIPWLRQHINSVMFSYLLLGEKPPKSMHFLAKDNMIYSYLYGEKCDTLYKNTGPWPAKDYPGKAQIKEQEYTPLCNLAGLYLQETL